MGYVLQRIEYWDEPNLAVASWDGAGPHPQCDDVIVAFGWQGSRTERVMLVVREIIVERHPVEVPLLGGGPPVLRRGSLHHVSVYGEVTADRARYMEFLLHTHVRWEVGHGRYVRALRKGARA